MEELSRRPSKLPHWLAVFIQKYLWITALAICFLPLIIMAFLDLSGTGNEWVLFLMIGGLLLFMLDALWLKKSGVGLDGRETRSYVRDDNEYDMTTLRLYTSLGYNWYILAASNFRKKNIIDEFRYNDGIIYVRTLTGLEYEAPVWETKFGYNLYKGGNGGDVFIYTLESNDGQQISFSKAEGVLEDDEFEDIFNILIRGEFVGESKKTKVLNFITNLFNEATEIGSDLSANDLVSQINDTLAEKTKMKVLGNYEKMSGEQLKDLIEGKYQTDSQKVATNDVSSKPPLEITYEESSGSKRKSVYIIIGIIAFVAILVACIFIFAEDNKNEFDYSDEDEYEAAFSDYTPRSCTIVVDSNGDAIGVYLATNASTYSVGGQDVFEVPKNGYHLVEMSAENGQGYLDYDKNVIVRQKPSISSKPVGQIEYWEGDINDPIPCLGYENGWYKVKVNGKIGYVSEDDVDWTPLDFS